MTVGINLNRSSTHLSSLFVAGKRVFCETRRMERLCALFSLGFLKIIIRIPGSSITYAPQTIKALSYSHLI